MANLVLSTVDFRGARLIVADVGGVHYVATEPICTALSLDWSAQLKRIRNSPVLSNSLVVISVPLASSPDNEAAYLLLNKLNGWLFMIDASRTKNAECRERLIQYQEECFDVLAAHFQKASAGVSPSPLLDDRMERAEVNKVREAIYNTQQTLLAMLQRLDGMAE